MTAPLPTQTSTSLSSSSKPMLTWAQLWSASMATSMGTAAFVALFVWLHHPGDVGRDVALLTISAYCLCAIVGFALGILVGTPYRRLSDLLRSGVAPEHLPRADVVRALRAPTHATWIVLAFHAFSAAVLGVVAGMRPSLAPLQIDFVVSTLALGVINATVQHYVVSALVRERLAPQLVPHGRLDHLVDEHGRLPRTLVVEHLVMMLATFGVAWPALVFIFLRTGGEGVQGPWSLGVLALMFLGLASLQTIGIIRTVSWAVGHLVTRMEQVRGGDLSVQARIFALDSFGVQASEFNRMVEGLRQREQLKETFGRYVTQQVANEILAGRVELGGELRTATVLFSDIRGFTRMSERMAPQEVVSFLNEYLSAMVDCVIEHGGVLDKFIGDAVMAVFGAPVGNGSVAADAAAAVACAQAMSKRLDEMNARRVAAGKDRIEIGIGLHTGELVAGNIGSPRRMQYTVIGDTVNVGARLESLTKESGRRTLMSAATAAHVRAQVPVVEVGQFAVRGRAEPLMVYALVDDPPEAARG